MNINAVLIDPQIVTSEFDQVLIDNEHGAFEAVQHLINSGHKRIGFISGDLHRLSFAQRFNGYKKALRFHNILYDKELVQSGGLEKGYDQVTKLIELQNRPTAIFSANDFSKKNKTIPYELIAIIGPRIERAYLR